MFRLLLFTVCIIFKTDVVVTEYGNIPIQENSKKAVAGSGARETEITEIRLDYNYDTNPNVPVWKDEPLKIIIENGNAQRVRCFNKYAITGGPVEEFVPDTEFLNKNDNTLYIKKVTAEMSTRWGCTVLQEYHGPPMQSYKNRNYTAKDLHFHLYVKGERQVILTANNQDVNYDVKTGLSVEYNGLANYTFRDGEDVEFSCRKAQSHTSPLDTVRLEYFSAEGILLFKSKSGTKINKFRSVLHSTNDKYYLDCICHSNRTGPVRENRYRTIFYIKQDAEEHAMKLFINGQKLATFFNNDTTVDDYIFKYIDGEILNVTCQEVHSFRKGTIHFSFDRNLNYQDCNNQEMGLISLKLLASNIHNTTLTCGIKDTKIQKPIARILFLTDVPDNDIRVRGLPRNNILYQYTNGVNQWTIEYQYSVIDTISLIGVAKSGVLSSGYRQGLRNSPLFQWKIEGMTIDSQVNWTEKLPSIKISDTITKILNAKHNGTKIMCTYFPKGISNKYINKTVEVIFRLKKEQSVFEREKNIEEVYTDKDSHLRMMVPIAITVVVGVAIITMLCVICWRKRTKRVNLIENAYDNLSNQNDSPIPAFPSQWESNYDDSHYTNIDEGVIQENYNYSTDEDSLYKMPYKRASNNSENHYTEIDDYFKSKHAGLKAKSNEPSNYKNTNALKGTTSHNSNDAFYNNYQGTYDKLIHNNLYINKDSKNNSNLKSKGKNKSVTFRQMSNDWRLASKCNEGSSRQEFRNNEQRLKQNNDGQYANIEDRMQPGDIKKPYNEDDFLKNKETVNSSDLDYAEPYSNPGVSCKKGFTTSL